MAKAKRKKGATTRKVATTKVNTTKCTELMVLLISAAEVANGHTADEVKVVQEALKRYANNVANSPPEELQNIAVNAIIDLGPASLMDVRHLIAIRERERAKFCGE
jgi:hypothetical protein